MLFENPREQVLTHAPDLQRELAEQEKYRYVTQYANQLAEITKLKEDRREAERNQDNQSNENMTTLVQACFITLELSSQLTGPLV